MNIVNGFDIDTVEGAIRYLESKDVDIGEIVLKRTLEIIRKKAFQTAEAAKELNPDYCVYCGTTPCKRIFWSHPLEDYEDEDE